MPTATIFRWAPPEMSLVEKIEQASGEIVSGGIALFTGAVVWLIRRVLTNQRQIELLQAEIKHRDALRREDREAVKEVRDDVKAMRSEIRDMFRRQE